MPQQQGGLMAGLGKLFQSPQDKERAKLNKQRRITYLKKKYGRSNRSNREEEE